PTSQNRCHIFYKGTNREIYELYCNYNRPTKRGNWKPNNLKSLSSAPLAASSGSPIAMESSTTHVFYSDSSGGIHEIWWKDRSKLRLGKSSWKHTAVTKRAGGSPNARKLIRAMV